MSRLHTATYGPTDWRLRLADPEKQWKRGYSAFEAAMSWEGASRRGEGLPAPITRLLEQHEELRRPELLLGIVEHKVPLKDGRRPSQNDVWALVRIGQNRLSLAVEAKAGEAFGEMISDWLKTPEKESNKPARLKYLRDVCGIRESDACDSRYQLHHRAASALIEAERFGAGFAVMVVQSFRNDSRKGNVRTHLEDFRVFTRQFGVEADENKLVKVPGRQGTQLYLGWVTCEPATDAEIAAASG